MKRAPKTKGRGWNVFDVSGAACNVGRLKGYCEIQRIDCPDDMAPPFDSDHAAVRHVVTLAKKGDEEAIDALWQAHTDPLVHHVLWEDCCGQG